MNRQQRTKATDPLTIFIGGLPGNISHKEVQKYFAGFTAKSLNIYLKFKSNGLCAGHGLLKLKDQEAYDTICRQDHYIRDRQIECRPYYSSSSYAKYKTKFQNTRIFVTKIPTDATNGELKRVFQSIGAVVKAYIIRNGKQNKTYDFGYVVFEKLKDAQAAVDINNFRLRGQQLLCKRYSPKNRPREQDVEERTQRQKGSSNGSGRNSDHGGDNHGQLTDEDFQQLMKRVMSGDQIMTPLQIIKINQIYMSMGIGMENMNANGCQPPQCGPQKYDQCFRGENMSKNKGKPISL